jgi:hypothetical protein
VPNVESLMDRVKFKGLTMARKAYSMLPFTAKQWYQNEYVFEAQDPEQAAQWLDLLCELTGLDWAERDMMILVNPESDKDSLKVLDAILPMFEAANVCVHIKSKIIRIIIGL